MSKLACSTVRTHAYTQTQHTNTRGGLSQGGRIKGQSGLQEFCLYVPELPTVTMSPRWLIAGTCQICTTAAGKPHRNVGDRSVCHSCHPPNGEVFETPLPEDGSTHAFEQRHESKGRTGCCTQKSGRAGGSQSHGDDQKFETPRPTQRGLLAGGVECFWYYW